MRAGDKIGLIGLILSIISLIFLVAYLIDPNFIGGILIFNYISIIFVSIALILSIAGIGIDHSIPGKIGAPISGVILIILIILILI